MYSIHNMYFIYIITVCFLYDLASRRTLQKRASLLVEKLRNSGIGNRPVIWVGHSMGGVLFANNSCQM